MPRHHPILYEINTHAWLTDLSRSSESLIHLGNIPDEEFERWEELGFTHIWLMGVWRTGPRARALAQLNWARFWNKEESAKDLNPEDVISSPYAIMDYHVAGHLGGEDGLRVFRSRLRTRGLKLILDFVPNHLGLDHPWIWSRPELLVTGERERPGMFHPHPSEPGKWFAHGKDPWFPSWTDTVQVDYRKGETHREMFHILQSIALRCDGARCDMAMLLLPEVFSATWESLPPAGDVTRENFWESSIPRIKEQFPEFIFIGEVYWDLEARMQRLGFDYTYDKRVYDYIVGRNPAALRHHLASQTPDFLRRSAHFLENHDEPRVSSLFSRPEHRAAAVLLLGLPGMNLLHDGQLAGRRLFSRIQMKARLSEETDIVIETLYAELLAAVKDSGIGEGEAHLLEPGTGGEACFVIQWQHRADWIDLVAVNLGTHSSKTKVILRGSVSGADQWIPHHLFGDHSPIIFDPAALTVAFELAAFGCQIISLHDATAGRPRSFS